MLRCKFFKVEITLLSLKYKLYRLKDVTTKRYLSTLFYFEVHQFPQCFQVNFVTLSDFTV